MTGVRVTTKFILVGKDQCWHVQVGLGWYRDDPHAVELWFVRDKRQWFTSRELLVEALTSDEAGDGDVRFRRLPDRPDFVGIGLRSPSGHADFLAPREALIELIVRSEPLFRPAVDAWRETWLSGVVA